MATVCETAVMMMVMTTEATQPLQVGWALQFTEPAAAGAAVQHCS